ncbi:MAG: nitroreductase family deazaflavin-dependent oxidoreductase [Chloroflexota bacterium]|nr:nitroreductase family deazaflavin-dependent oxidoreductase [Chloroflexota bacterium]
MPAIRRTPLVELFWRMHKSVFRASGGRLMSRVGPLPVLLLSVRGRKSGVARDVLLNYVRDGARFVVFASHAGEDRDPPWWLNLRDAGEGELLVDGKRVRVRAREAVGADRDRLWSEAKRRDDAFVEYEKRTSRRIAVVVLEVAEGAPRATQL